VAATLSRSYYSKACDRSSACFPASVFATPYRS